MKKPFSPSADRNKEPILHELKRELSPKQRVLEIGSGTGQHACYFASELPDISWQPSELGNNISGIKDWMTESDLPNVLEPIELDVNTSPWPVSDVHACFTSNTFHIVSMRSVLNILSCGWQVLKTNGKLCVYGPFSINNEHTSVGNVQFDKQLRASSANSGIRDVTELDNIAQRIGFAPCKYTDMPANNLFVVWEKTTQHPQP